MSMQITGQKKKKDKEKAAAAKKAGGSSTPPPAPLPGATPSSTSTTTSGGGGANNAWGSASSNHSKVQFDSNARETTPPPPAAASSSTTTTGGGRKPQGPESYIALAEVETMNQVTVSFKDLVASEAGDGGDAGTRLISALNEFGFAVVADVLDETTVSNFEGLWEADLKSLVSTSLKVGASEEVEFLKDPIHNWPTHRDEFQLGTKFATMYGLPQGQCAWAARGHPNVKKVYEVIYGTEDLCVGIDNMFFNPKDSAVAKESSRTTNLWPHADQNYNCQPEGRYDVYQSVVYLWPATSETSATVVWPSSNSEVYNKLMASTNAKGHFCMLPKTQHLDFAKAARRVPVPRGGMLLWSSKTIHQGWPHGKRLAVPVCFEPSHRRSTAALKRKIECVKTGKPTTHWASLGKPHSMSGLANGDAGGTPTVQLVHQAHLHALDSKGQVQPHVFKLL